MFGASGNKKAHKQARLYIFYMKHGPYFQFFYTLRKCWPTIFGHICFCTGSALGTYTRSIFQTKITGGLKFVLQLMMGLNHLIFASGYHFRIYLLLV